MPVQRKIFRIEQVHPVAAVGAGAVVPDLPQREVFEREVFEREVLAELKALRDLIEQRTGSGRVPYAGAGDPSGLRQLRDNTGTIHRALNRTKQEILALYAGAFSDAGESRATRELDAVVDSTERATRRILDAAEDIEEAANTLSASLKHTQEQALAQDIRDQVIRIFEACNFQDLSGQRITKVLATLQFVEDHITRMMEIWGDIAMIRDEGAAASVAHQNAILPLHGPQLDGDPGHASQDDIDKLFARG
jgi:chemotaxis protein CheZ